MGSGRRLFAEEARFTRARARRTGLDGEAVEAAAQALLETWPWLAEQYRQGVVTELPTVPLGIAIRRYLAHAGIDPQ